MRKKNRSFLLMSLISVSLLVSVFTIVQQYVLMRRFKVENPIDDFFARWGAPKATG